MKYPTLTEQEAQFITAMATGHKMILESAVVKATAEAEKRGYEEVINLCDSLIEKMNSVQPYEAMTPLVALWVTANLKELNTLTGENFEVKFKWFDAELGRYRLKLMPTVNHKYGVTYMD